MGIDVPQVEPHARWATKLATGAGKTLVMAMAIAWSGLNNDRLFLEIPCRYMGRTLRYRPDFLVKLPGDVYVLIEGKGRKDEKDDSKWTAARRWVAAGRHRPDNRVVGTR